MKARSIKKALGIALTAAMVFTMAMPTFAAGGSDKFPASPYYDNGDDFSIKITSKYAGYEYSAYQVLAGNLEKGGKTLTDVEWGDGIKPDEFVKELKKIPAFSGLGENASARDFAKIFDQNSSSAEIAKAVADAASKALANVAGKSGNYTDGNYVISPLWQGYYFVKDSSEETVPEGGSYTKFITKVLERTDEYVGAVIEVKMDVPEGVKKVQENGSREVESVTRYGDGYADAADYGIGDPVPFELIAKVPEIFKKDENGNDIYKEYYLAFSDVMGSGFTFDANADKAFDVTVGDANDVDNGRKLAKGTDYTVEDVTTAPAPAFKIVFKNLKNVVTSDEVGKDIIVRFSAVLNENAVVGLEGNENKMKILYTNNPNQDEDSTPGETPEDKVVVFTYELDTTKLDGESGEKLADAEFVLYREKDGKKEYVKLNEADKVAGWVAIDGTPGNGQSESAFYEAAGATILKSGSDGEEKGKFAVIGLDDGVYYMHETKAPSGYNKLTSDIKLNIKATVYTGQDWTGIAGDALTNLELAVDDGESKEGNVGEGSVAQDVLNNKGVELPSTGGMGTTMFYMIGGVLLVGAGVLLVSRKRMNG